MKIPNLDAFNAWYGPWRKGWCIQTDGPCRDAWIASRKVLLEEVINVVSCGSDAVIDFCCEELEKFNG